MRIPAYAKINLFLSVLDRRPDGYHNIESVMQSVSLSDTVTVDAVASERTNISLTISTPRQRMSCSSASAEMPLTAPLPVDERNIAYRAAELFLRERNMCADVRIHIEKNIPVAGGLAGGSTDGAAVLRGLNEIFGSPFSTDELCRIGAGLGADIPFCIVGGTAETFGIGEIISPLPPLPDCTILIVRPHESVSTAGAYAKIDSMMAEGAGAGVADGKEGAQEERLPKANALPTLAEMTTALRKGSLTDMSSAAYNVFESVMPPSSEVFHVKAILSENGALLSMMSGSGPTVFGIFEDKDDASRAANYLADAGYESVLTAPVTRA